MFIEGTTFFISSEQVHLYSTLRGYVCSTVEDIFAVQSENIIAFYSNVFLLSGQKKLFFDDGTISLYLSEKYHVFNKLYVTK